LPFFVRNLITSGHLLFPANLPVLIKPDWSFDSSKLAEINNYILSYARFHKPAGAVSSAVMSFPQWVGIWWQDLHLSYKVLLIVVLLSFLNLLITQKKILAIPRPTKVLMAISITGILFWWLKAPDPRFGLGFLLLFPAMVLNSTHQFGGMMIFKSRAAFLLTCWTLIAGITLYTGYRFQRFFAANEWMVPAGITLPLETTYYKQVNANIPLTDNATPSQVIISATTPPTFLFRGQSLQQGFKAKPPKK
jgi:hypothetical protein